VRNVKCLGRRAGGIAGVTFAGLVLVASPLQAEDRPAAVAGRPVIVTPLLSTSATSSGQPIVMPQKDVQIVVSHFDIAPGATLPEHQHPFPRYGYVEAGTLRVTNVETGKTATYGPGSFILEAVGQWHKAENAGTEPIKLLVIDIMEKGANNNTVLKN
jgi:quercetin dioxygenase-like cupin family protein